MAEDADYVGTAKVFWSGRSQAVRLPAACRFEVAEVENRQAWRHDHLAPTR